MYVVTPMLFLIVCLALRQLLEECVHTWPGILLRVRSLLLISWFHFHLSVLRKKKILDMDVNTEQISSVYESQKTATCLWRVLTFIPCMQILLMKHPHLWSQNDSPKQLFNLNADDVFR